MADYKSEIKAIPYADSQVYAILSDLSNLEKIKGSLDGRGAGNLVCSPDSCSIAIDTVGTLEFTVVERQPYSIIKLASSKMGIPIIMTVELTPVSTGETNLQITASINVNPFMASMVESPLKEALNKTAEAVASISYA
ncbi:MAG: SRPBCC family protein [Tannerellaceae bacterium]|jgi:hypothetical protein|nr:SRPBCC family protein [Tannerellaceae bacterium]